MKINKPLPFTVIGGFLGSGKTSFLNSILATNKSRRYAVLVNDFGSLNIDKALITKFDGKLLHLSNGCICCSMSSGLVDSMLILMQKAEYLDHILVEASGVSHPTRIMDFARIDKDLQPAAILVMVDCINLQNHMQNKLLKETIANQLSSADVILLTKTDIADKEQIKKSQSIIKSSQSNLPIITLDNNEQKRALVIETLLLSKSKRLKDNIFSCASANHNASHNASHNTNHNISDSAKHIEVFKTLVFKSKIVLSKNDFLGISKKFSNLILRGKGFVNCVDGRYFWQQVGRQIEFNKVSIDRKNPYCELVIISTDELAELKSKLSNLGLETCS